MTIREIDRSLLSPTKLRSVLSSPSHPGVRGRNCEGLHSGQQCTSSHRSVRQRGQEGISRHVSDVDRIVVLSNGTSKEKQAQGRDEVSLQQINMAQMRF